MTQSPSAHAYEVANKFTKHRRKRENRFTERRLSVILTARISSLADVNALPCLAVSAICQ